MTTHHPDVQIVPNTGWDHRITAFQYKRIVTNFTVVSERYVVVIDTLVGPTTAAVMVEAMRDALQAGRQLLVINTHADWDHYWGNGLFVGPDARYPAPIIGHHLCRERVLAGAGQDYLAKMQQTDPATFNEVRLYPPTLTFDGAFTIHGGDLTFQLVHTPGHKSDHVSVFIPEIRTLFPVDAAEDPLPLVYNAADVPLMRTSFERMLALEPETVLYHHALGSIKTDVIHQNIAYFNDIERRAIEVLATGKVPDQFDASVDIEALMNYPLSEAPHVDALAGEEERMFYLDAHRNALRTTLEYVRNQREER